MTEPASSDLEQQISAIADGVIAEGKTGYNWSEVDGLLQEALDPRLPTRCKRANSSGRAANVLTESNDKDVGLYMVFVQSPYTIDQFDGVARNRMSRFELVRAVAVADRSAGTWRVRRYFERQGEGIADSLGDRLTDAFPLLSLPDSRVTVPAFDHEASPPPTASAVSIDPEDFEHRVASMPAPEAPSPELLDEFAAFVAERALNFPMSVLADAVASFLSSQLVFLAGPSGTGKSQLGRCLMDFFSQEAHSHVVEGRRQLLGPEDLAGYFSNISDRFAVGPETLGLVGLHEAAFAPQEPLACPILLVEEANLSTIEGYLAPVVHGLSAPSVPIVKWRLHARLAQVEDPELAVEIPPQVYLGPFPRFLATINVDASAHAPARKVVSRGLVLLLEPETPQPNRIAELLSGDPPVSAPRGAGANHVGDPAATLRSLDAAQIETLLATYLDVAKQVAGTEVNVDPSYRDLRRVLQYMSVFVALTQGRGSGGVDLTRLAAENAFMHVSLPALNAADFVATVNSAAKSTALCGAADPEGVGGLLQSRVRSLARSIEGSLFADSVDFWTALS